MTCWIYCCTSGRCIIELLYGCIFQTAGMCWSLAGTGGMKGMTCGKLEGRIPRGGVGLDGGSWWRRGRKGGSEAMLSHKMPCCHLKSTPKLPALIKFVTIVTIMPAIPLMLFVLRDPKTRQRRGQNLQVLRVFLCRSFFLSKTGKMQL